MLTPPPGTTLFIEGNEGGQVGPDGTGTIYLIGLENVTISGDPGTNTLEVSTDGEEATVTTNDATPTIIASVEISSGFANMISCQFVAVEEDVSVACGGNAFTVARNAGGGAQLSGGSHQSIVSNVANPGTGVSFQESGNNIDIYVTGAVATTLNWRMFIKSLVNS
jgi:hypothetical protein